MLTRTLSGLNLRAVDPQGDIQTDAGLQAWNADHLGYRWSQAQDIGAKLMSGSINADEWLDLMDAMLLEGHANAWWIGRAFAGDDGEFGEDDLLYGRGFRDADADYLFGFYERIKDGQYQNDDGTWKQKKLHANARLYIGKMRGTSNEGFVQTSPDDSVWYWRLGGVEDHCAECPEYVGIFDGVPKNQLFLTPGSGDTPCLGNCLCYLESVVGSSTRVGPRAVALPYEEDQYEIAA